ncbi:hypothetical protein [Viridibacillus arvi]|uniref:hypothetical protein n=1 Tax=Viridibacillus arvi TaxID=263475 RepID=UPI0034CD8E72
MNWLTIIPIILYLLYHSLNVFTDIKYRITKNLWHLLFLVIGLGFYYGFAFSNAWYHPLGALIVTLVIGLVLEKIRLSSPGDTKMFMVTAIYLSLMLPHHAFFRIGLAVVMFHLLLVSVITYAKLFKDIGVVQTFKNQINDIKALVMPGVPISKFKVFEHFPGAVTIMLGGLVYFIAVTFLESRGIGY